MNALKLREQFLCGDRTPTIVVSDCLAACTDSTLGAFITIDHAGASEAAQHSRERYSSGKSIGAWDGIPIAIKDNIAVAKLAWTAGIGAYRNRIADADAPTVARLRAAGAVIMGKCNMHEAALGTTNDNPWFGRCENPHRSGFTPGGSSGGSAVAVATGLAALALGTDTLGSVRIPAACCGIYGYKPSAGLVSQVGVTPLSEQLDTIGLLAANHADLVAYGASLAGLTAGEPTTPNVVGRLPNEALACCEPAIRSAYEQAIERLAEAGATIGTVDWFANPSALRRAGLILCEVEAYAAHRERLLATPTQFSDGLVKFLHYGRDLAPEVIARARHDIEQFTQQLHAFSRHVDCILTPATPTPTHSFAEPAPARFADFTAPANVSGRPAVAIPNGTVAAQLPLGLQLLGQRDQDELLFSYSAWIDVQLNGDQKCH